MNHRIWALIAIALCTLLSGALWSQQQTDTVTATDQTGAEQAITGEQAEKSEDSKEDPADDDFKPSEEISEDYPIPLPSDI